MAFYIVPDLCKGCGACAGVCPREAVVLLPKRAAIEPARCDECEECLFVCPNGAITGGLTDVGTGENNTEAAG